MKPIRLHPLSIAVCLAVVSGFVVLTSQTTLPTYRFGPHPRDFIEIHGGPYTVPPGKILMITGVGFPTGYGYLGAACGATSGEYTVSVFINGAGKFDMYDNVLGSAGPAGRGSMIAVPPGLKATSGSSVTVFWSDVTYCSGAGLYGTAWGYLADQ